MTTKYKVVPTMGFEPLRRYSPFCLVSPLVSFYNTFEGIILLDYRALQAAWAGK